MILLISARKHLLAITPLLWIGFLPNDTTGMSNLV